jgi:hypothetical protein
MKQLWGILKMLWVDCNERKDRNTNFCTDQKQRIKDRRIKCLYRRLEVSLRQEDEFLCRIRLDSLLQKPWAYRKEWLAQATVINSRLYDTLRTADVRQRTREQSRHNRRQQAGRNQELRQQLAQSMAWWLRRGHGAEGVNS